MQHGRRVHIPPAEHASDLSLEVLEVVPHFSRDRTMTPRCYVSQAVPVSPSPGRGKRRHRERGRRSGVGPRLPNAALSRRS